ncbi:hypothetical protein MBANPS3_007942 [Mucor bainieri]
MLNHLPPEIVEYIISYLNTKAKKQFSLVCHRWYDLVIHHSMYSHIVIEDNHIQDVKQYFEGNQQQCQQVHSVFMHTEGGTNQAFYLAPLSEHFPRLQEFALRYKFLKSGDPKPNPYILHQTILERGAFVNLTHLRLEFSYEGSTGTSSQLFQHLHLAPKLKHLVLKHLVIALRDMEVLHERAPLLETLDLESFTGGFEQIEENSVGGYDIHCEPAPKCLTHLSLRDMSQNDSDITYHDFSLLWMKYISNKYIHLKHLTIHMEPYTAIDLEDEQMFQTVLAGELLPSLSLLETYNVNIVPINQQILEAMDNGHLKLKAMGIADSSREINKHMVDLLNSKQADTIQSLSITSYEMFDENPWFELWQPIGGFRALRHLEIGNPGDHRSSVPLDLTLFIHGVPQLESFKASRLTVELLCDVPDKNCSKVNWKSIELSKVELSISKASHDSNHTALMTYIAYTCAALEHFILQGWPVSKVYGVFQFPHRYIKTLEVDIGVVNFYKVYNKKQVMWYEFDGMILVKRHLQEPNRGEQIYASIMYEGSSSLKIKGTDIPNW